MSKRMFLNVIICMALILSVASLLIADAAEAKDARAAIVESVTGTVQVKKAGGNKTFRAYVNMTLNYGDYITTGDNSSVVLKVVDREDEVTIGSNAEMFISDLSEDQDGNKKSKFRMWAGSLFAKAASLFNAKDEFEIETPTAIMGVRGTHFIVGIDRVTGVPRIIVKSGQVEATQAGEEAGRTTINPGEQIIIISEVDTELDHFKMFVDPNDIASELEPSLIEKIIESAADIAAENSRFIQESGLESEFDEETIERLEQNLQHLVGHLVNAAIDTGQLTEEQYEQMVERARERTGADPAINRDVPPLSFTDEERARMEQQRQQLKEKLQRKQEEKREKEEQKQRENQELAEQLQQQREEREEENRRIREEQERLAQELLREQLDEEERQQFEERVREREQEREQQEQGQAGPPAQSEPPPSTGGGSTPTPPMLNYNVLDEWLEFLSNFDYGPGFSKYTEESFKQLQDTVILAHEIRATATTQGQIDDMIDALQAAFEGLVEREVIDTTELQTLLSLALEIDRVFVTEQSYLQLLEAIERAQSVINMPQSQGEVAEAVSMLAEAIEALEEREIVTILEPTQMKLYPIGYEGDIVLRETVMAMMSDGEFYAVPVDWDLSVELSFDVQDEFLIYGKIEGYMEQVTTIIRVDELLDIGGVITLPNGAVAPPGGIDIHLTVSYDYQSWWNNHHLHIEAGESSVSFSDSVLKCTDDCSSYYTVDYFVKSQHVYSNYFPTAYLTSDMETSPRYTTVDLMALGDDATQMTIELLEGHLISGHINFAHPVPEDIFIDAAAMEVNEGFYHGHRFKVEPGSQVLDYFIPVIPHEVYDVIFVFIEGDMYQTGEPIFLDEIVYGTVEVGAGDVTNIDYPKYPQIEGLEVSVAEHEIFVQWEEEQFADSSGYEVEITVNGMPADFSSYSQSEYGILGMDFGGYYESLQSGRTYVIEITLHDGLNTKHAIFIVQMDKEDLDFTELLNLIAYAESLDGSHYTEESYEYLQWMLYDAYYILEAAMHQSEIDEYVIGLQAAIESLVYETIVHSISGVITLAQPVTEDVEIVVTAAQYGGDQTAFSSVVKIEKGESSAEYVVPVVPFSDYIVSIDFVDTDHEPLSHEGHFNAEDGDVTGVNFPIDPGVDGAEMAVYDQHIHVRWDEAQEQYGLLVLVNGFDSSYENVSPTEKIITGYYDPYQGYTPLQPSQAYVVEIILYEHDIYSNRKHAMFVAHTDELDLHAVIYLNRNIDYYDEPILVEFGAEEILLPQQVSAIMSNGAKKKVHVKWDDYSVNMINSNFTGYYDIFGNVMGSGEAFGATVRVAETATISGTIALPQGMTAPEGGLQFEVRAEDQNEWERYSVEVTIPAGDESAPFTIAVPKDEQAIYYLHYYLVTNNDLRLVNTGHYSTDGTVSFEFEAEPLDVASGDVSGIQLDASLGATISGKIVLSEPAGAGGETYFVMANANNNNDRFLYEFKVKEGHIDVDYTIVVPSEHQYYIEYGIGTNIYSYGYGETFVYYEDGISNYYDGDSKTEIDTTNGDVYNIYLAFYDPIQDLNILVLNDAFHITWDVPADQEINEMKLYIYTYEKLNIDFAYSTSFVLDKVGSAYGEGNIDLEKLKPNTTYVLELMLWSSDLEDDEAYRLSRRVLQLADGERLSGLEVTDLTSDSFSIAWDPYPGANMYSICFIDYDGYWDCEDVNAPTTEHTFSDLSPDTYYGTHVSARINGEIRASATVSVSTVDNFDLFATDIGETHVFVQWNGFQYYEYEITVRDELDQVVDSRMLQQGHSSYSIENLLPNTRYTIELRVFMFGDYVAIGRIEVTTGVGPDQSSLPHGIYEAWIENEDNGDLLTFYIVYDAQLGVMDSTVNINVYENGNPIPISDIQLTFDGYHSSEESIFMEIVIFTAGTGLLNASENYVLDIEWEGLSPYEFAIYEIYNFDVEQNDIVVYAEFDLDHLPDILYYEDGSPNVVSEVFQEEGIVSFRIPFYGADITHIVEIAGIKYRIVPSL